MNADPQTCLAAQRADGLPSQRVDRQLMFTDGRIARECFRAEETPAQQKTALKKARFQISAADPRLIRIRIVPKGD
jgi:hypothetical protein